MYVCICRAVTEDAIRREVRCGATNLCSLAERLGTATKCGRCRIMVMQTIRATLALECDACEAPVAGADG